MNWANSISGKGTLPRRGTELCKAAACTVIVGLGAAYSIAVQAQALSLQEAYMAASSHDANILASRAATHAHRERLVQARSQLRPSVGVNLGRTWNDLTSTNRTVVGDVSSDSQYFSASQVLSVRQPIYRKHLSASVDQAIAQVVDAESQLERDEQQLLIRVTEVYFESLLAQEQLRMVTSQLGAYRLQLEAARRLFEGGVGTRTDVDEARARVDLASAQELEARQNRDYSVRQLELMTGRAVANLADVEPGRFRADPLGRSLTEWIDRAMQASAEIAALRAQRDAAELEISKARAGHTPTIDAVAQWSRSVSDNVTSVNSKYINRSVGIQISVPIYSGGYVDSTVRQAYALLERAEQALEAGRRDLSARVHREYRRVTEGGLRVAAHEQALASAEVALESSRRSFQGGRRSNLDVLNAEQQRSIAVRDLAQARITYLVSAVRLRALAGDARQDNLNAVGAMLAAR